MPDEKIVEALEAAVELVGKVVAGDVTQEDSNTGVLASYAQQFRDALDLVRASATSGGASA